MKKNKLSLHYNILKIFFKRSKKLLRMEKSNFYFFLLSFILATAGNIATFFVGFSIMGTFKGWDMYSMLILLATYRISRGTFGLLMGANMESMFKTIRSGNLDTVLIKPASTWFLLSFKEIDLSRAVDLITAIGLLVYALNHIEWTWMTLGLYFIMTLVALVIVTCCYVLIGLTAFFNLRSSILSFIEKLMRATTRYPLRFANDAIQFVFTWVIPFMFITTIPTEVLQNKINLPTALISGITISSLMILLTRFCWTRMIQKYSSASS